MQVIAGSLAMSFFLPMSRCPRLVQSGDPTLPDYLYVRPYQALEGGPSPGGAVVAIPFLWPLALGLLQRFWVRGRRPRLMRSAEIALCFGSGCMILELSQLGEPWWGAVVAATAVIVFATISAAELVSLFRARARS